MPKLSDKESLELSDLDLKVTDNTTKYVKVIFKEMYKYFDKEEKIKLELDLELRI